MVKSILSNWWMTLSLLNNNRDEYFVGSLTGQHWSSFLKIYIGNYGFGIFQKDPTAWSNWSEYGDCNTSCGDGIMTRTRKCFNGSPGDPGCDDGEIVEQQSCYITKCSPTWSTWSDFSTCSTSCGDGIVTRTRECDNGSPGDPGCHEGETVEQQSCEIAKCSFWTGWLDYLSFYPYITYPVSLFMIIYLLILVKKMKEDFSNKQQQLIDEIRKTKKQNPPTSIHDHGENTSW